MPPVCDLDAERRLAEVLVGAGAAGELVSAHDLSDGGLAQGLAECVMRHGVGAAVTVAGDPFVALFSESAGRALVSVAAGDVEGFRARCDGLGVPVEELGRTGGASLSVTSAPSAAAPDAIPDASETTAAEGPLFDLTVETLRASWTPTLRAALA